MKRVLKHCGLLLIGLLAGSSAVFAAMNEYTLPPANSRLIGHNYTVTVPDNGEPLETIAAENKIGLIAMLEANPGTDPFLPKAGSILTIPAQMLLPDTPREGIVINLAELRLYYFPPKQNKVIVYPIGIGQLGRNTPTMTTSVSQKIPNPTWTPTANIRKIYAAEGTILPAVWPAGPDNPMGQYAMRLAAHGGTYLIHGTNADFGIGMRVSSGCIRLRPDDIEALFRKIPVGTRVQVINEPIKVSVEPDGKRYIEVHQPLSRTASDDPQTLPIAFNAKVSAFMSSPLVESNLVD
ncbi:MAG: L,D-transpeptidase family protein, partial [Enterobacteriaceae bacterium]